MEGEKEGGSEVMGGIRGKLVKILKRIFNKSSNQLEINRGIRMLKIEIFIRLFQDIIIGSAQ